MSIVSIADLKEIERINHQIDNHKEAIGRLETEESISPGTTKGELGGLRKSLRNLQCFGGPVKSIFLVDQELQELDDRLDGLEDDWVNSQDYRDRQKLLRTAKSFLEAKAATLEAEIADLEARTPKLRSAAVFGNDVGAEMLLHRLRTELERLRFIPKKETVTI